MYRNSIKSWAVQDRPREKFIKNGPAALSTTELLAILIRSGTADRSALVVAQDILAVAKNSLSKLAKLPMGDLLKVKGVGEAKAIVLLAALEIGKRRRIEKAQENIIIKSSADAFSLMKPLMEDLLIEQFWVLYLNNANHVVDKCRVSEGGMTATIVDVRLILKRALALNATALILCHNHPSGTLEPSKADQLLTDKVVKAASFMDIQVLDHLIVTEQSYFSFADQGRI